MMYDIISIGELSNEYKENFKEIKNILVKLKNNVTLVVGYNDYNQFVITKYPNTNINSQSIDPQNLLNSMVKYKITNPEIENCKITANAEALTYMEVINYAKFNAKFNSQQPNIIVDYIEHCGVTSIPINQVQSKLQHINKISNKDFVIVPIRVNSSHFANAIIKFNKEGQQESIYIFDSLGNESPILRKNVNHPNNENLQGSSETCGYWATNCAILASRYENFNKLKTDIDNKAFTENLKKTVSLLIDGNMCYSEITQSIFRYYQIPQNSKSNRELIQNQQSNQSMQQIYGAKGKGKQTIEQVKPTSRSQSVPTYLNALKNITITKVNLNEQRSQSIPQKTKKHKLQKLQVQFWQNKYPPKASKASKGCQENNRMQNKGVRGW